MANIYKNITTATTTTLTSFAINAGNIDKVLVCNRSNNSAIIALWIQNSSNEQYFFCKNVILNGGGTLVLEDNVNFDGLVFQLKINNTGSSPEIDVIIK